MQGGGGDADGGQDEEEVYTVCCPCGATEGTEDIDMLWIRCWVPTCGAWSHAPHVWRHTKESCELPYMCMKCVDAGAPMPDTAPEDWAARVPAPLGQRKGLHGGGDPRTKKQCSPHCPAPGCYMAKGCCEGMGDLGSAADWKAMREWVLHDAAAAVRYEELDGVDGEWAFYDPGDGRGLIHCKVKEWYRGHVRDQVQVDGG